MAQPAPVPFSVAHQRYVMYLYRTVLRSARDWIVDRDQWRLKCIEIRAQHFERHRDVSDPRALKRVLEETEKMVASWAHPDPYRPPQFPGGVEWERNAPPPLFSEEVQEQAREALRESGVLPEDRFKKI